MARRSLTSDFGHLGGGAVAQVLFQGANEEVALHRRIYPVLDVGHVVEDRRAQAHRRADGDVQDSDG